MFANNNPETVLPDNLDVDVVEVGFTTVGCTPQQSVGTVD